MAAVVVVVVVVVRKSCLLFQVHPLRRVVEGSLKSNKEHNAPHRRYVEGSLRVHALILQQKYYKQTNLGYRNI